MRETFETRSFNYIRKWQWFYNVKTVLAKGVFISSSAMIAPFSNSSIVQSGKSNRLFILNESDFLKKWLYVRRALLNAVTIVPLDAKTAFTDATLICEKVRARIRQLLSDEPRSGKHDALDLLSTSPNYRFPLFCHIAHTKERENRIQTK